MVVARMLGFGQVYENGASLQDSITHVLRAARIEPFPAGTWTVNQVSFDSLVDRIVQTYNTQLPPGAAKVAAMDAAQALIGRGYKSGTLPVARHAANITMEPEATEPPRPPVPTTYRDAAAIIAAQLPTETFEAKLNVPFTPPREKLAPDTLTLPALIPPSPKFTELPTLPMAQKSNKIFYWIAGALALYVLGKAESTPIRSSARKSRKRPAPGLSSLGGLSGKTANCVSWQEVESKKTGGLLWRCLLQAPACNGKDCKSSPAKGSGGKLRTCAKTKKVPTSDPRVKKKTVTRCARYVSACLTGSCVPEPFEKPAPSPGHQVNVKRMTADLARQMAEDRNIDEETGGKAFGREIMERGGIRAYKGRSRSGKRVKGGEEFAAVPIFMRKKNGLPLDEMASEMGFDGDTELLEAIKKEYPAGRTKKRVWTAADFRVQAEAEVWNAIEAGMVGGLGADLFAPKEKELFPGLTRELVLEQTDIATSDDQLEIFMQRKGWDINRVRALQDSIAEKLTPDMFTGKTKALSAGEIELQRDVQEFLDAASKKKPAKKSKKAAKPKRDPFWIDQPSQPALFGLGSMPTGGIAEGVRRSVLGDTLGNNGCRDKDGKFIAVPQCTGRQSPKKEAKEKAPEDMSAKEAEAERSILNKKAIQNLKDQEAINPGLYAQYIPKPGRTLSHDIATHYLTRDEMMRYKLLTRVIAITYMDPEKLKRLSTT